MFLVTLRSVADSMFLFGLSLLTEFLSCAVMFKFLQDCKTYGDGTTPDSEFGFSRQELQDWYDGMGQEGCESYTRAAKWDLFPFMISYMVLVGSALVYAARRARWNDAIAYIVGLTLLSDLVETGIFIRGCQVYPDPLEPSVLFVVASIANQTKWVSFATAVCLVPALLMLGAVTRRHHEPKSHHKE
jgi:hypothetical protein